MEAIARPASRTNFPACVCAWSHRREREFSRHVVREREESPIRSARSGGVGEREGKKGRRKEGLMKG